MAPRIFRETTAGFAWVFATSFLLMVLNSFGPPKPLGLHYFCPPMHNPFEKYFQDGPPNLAFRFRAFARGLLGFGGLLASIFGQTVGNIVGLYFLRQVLPQALPRLPALAEGVSPMEALFYEAAFTFVACGVIHHVKPIKAALVFPCMVGLMILGSKFTGPVLNPSYALASFFLSSSREITMEKIAYVVGPCLGGFLFGIYVRMAPIPAPIKKAD
eukprot:TRINITY_DN1713_c0_g1::TRINITY_DN1713_c0_g1_i1::g.25215::m.25215 TRINITY_DN1713_c0_g1::TRINITY_DN1713_c0_g1_i1::g.25215  ORF type:complete len:239 (-),score=41.42 TRINITY_DN1713_c0_g1_i1:16-660(-)